MTMPGARGREGQARWMPAPEALLRIAGLRPWQFDPASGRMRMCEAGLALLGLPADEPAPALPDVLAVVDARDRDALRTAIDAAADGGGLDVACRLAAGGRWLRFATMPDAQPRPRRLLDGILHPIGYVAASHADAAQRATGAAGGEDSILRRGFEDAPIGLAVIRPDGTVALANATFRRLTGVDGDLRGHAIAASLHPEGRDAAAALHVDLLSGRASRHEADECFVRPDGTHLWVHSAVTPLRDETGQVTALLRSAVDITERRRLVDDLRRREALARVAGRLALVGGWTLCVERGEFEWSSEVHAIVGWPASHPLPSMDEIWSLHPPQWRAPLRDALQRCIDAAEPYRVDAQLETPAGELKWVSVAAEPELDAHGRVGRVVGVLQDISALRRTEDELDRVSTSLRATMESMSDGFYLLDHQWRFAFVNAQAERLLGRDAAGLVGRSVWEAFPEAAAIPEFAYYYDAVEDGTSRTFEVWYPPLGDWFEITAHPSPEGLAVYFRRITERKQMMARLVASEDRFRHVAAATADAVWDWDLETDALWLSSGFESLFGYRISEVEPDSRAWASRIHPADVGRVVQGIYDVIDGREIQWRDEYRFRRADGRYVPIADRGFVIRDEAGRALRMVGGMADMSERQALEAQLRQSQRLDAVGQLTGGMAHDFNNLLTVIMGNADVLAEQLPAEGGLGGLAEMIGQAAQRGADLTSRMLAFARRQVLEPRPVDVNELLAGMDGLLRRTLGEHVELEILPGADLWLATADPAQLESAVLNLCINARDAMPEGGRLIIETANERIDAEYAERQENLAAGPYVMVAVSDTGCGILPEHLGRVFEPFFTTKETGKGTGLGLSMVYGFVKQSRGHVSIYSEPGEGTTVRLYLPMQLGVATARPPAEVEIQGGAGRVLMVEDDALVRRYAHTQLTSLGYEVLVACNGLEALEVLRSDQPIDLLFTDVVMPGGINGRQLAEQATALRPGLPVLFTSGYTENAMTHGGRLDPDVQLLAKPYRKAELARRVRQVLGGSARPVR